MPIAKVETAIMVTEQEKRLLGILRTVQYGHVTVVMQNGNPVRVEEVRKSVQL